MWVLALMIITGATALLCTASANAALIFPSLGQISDPEPGQPFGHVDSNSVAVNDFNNHILVADSRVGLVYDFSSASDTAPKVIDGSSTPAGSFGGGLVSVAVDNASGDFYVADTTHEVIDKFDAAGTLITSFGDTTPSPNGQLAGTATPAGSFLHPKTETPLSITVDQSTHDLYVIDSGHEHEVIDVFDENGAFLPLKQITEAPGGLYGCEGLYTDGIAVNASSGHVLVSDSCPPAQTYEFDATGAFVKALDGSNTPAGFFGGYTSVAIDNSSGRIYIVSTANERVYSFDAEGNFLGEISGTPASANGGVAVDQATGNVYVSDNQAQAVKIFGAPLVIPDVTTTSPSNLALTSATLNGTVNPDNEGNATCQFQWGLSKAFGHTAPCSEEVPDGNAPVAVHADVSGLEQDTEYCFRLQASNKNGTNQGEASQDHCFKTTGPGLHGQSVSAVTAESATLHAKIDPNNAPTTFYFQYGTSTAYGTNIPVPPGASIGEGEGDVDVSPQHIQGLQSHAVYHYRVVAISELSPGVFEEFDSPDQSFTTQLSGAELVLPDDRSWELVSPVDKHGALIQPIGEEWVIQAAPTGEAITYVANGPLGSEPQGNSRRPQILSTRSPSGWNSEDIAIPHAVATGEAVGAGQDYRFFSEDLSHAAVEPSGAFPEPSSPASLTSEASEQTPYLRSDFLNENTSEPCLPATMHCFRPMVTGVEGFANVPEGTVFGQQGGRKEEGPEFLGASPDLRHVVTRSSVPLTETTPAASEGGLYEWSADKPASEQLELVSVLPGGVPASGAVLGSEQGGSPSRRGAISKDGSHVVWESATTKALYMRDLASDETVQLDAVQGGSGEDQTTPHFQLANPDGSRVLFTDTQRLTNGSGKTVEVSTDLYECEMEEEAGKLKCKLKDLTPPGAGEEGAEVQGGVIGSANDGSSVYFVAKGALSGTEANEHGEKAQSGQPNLYVREGGVTKLIAVLSGEDSPDWGRESAGQLRRMTARVSPNGRWLTFMSQRSLTGYDNRDANNGEPDEEVFIYDADTGHLACASCNPTGARPVGVEYRKVNNKLVGGNSVWLPSTWIASNIPGWTPYELNAALYQSRYLSNSGRLFFNSNDALTPQDVNGTQDVYEFEPPGVGNCTTASQSFNQSSGGCLSLISSGTSAEESAFLDASEDGGDVFFLTSAPLRPQDVDKGVDVYDAHVCTTAVPCLPEPPETSPPCDTGDSCKAAPTPQPSIFGAPSSQTFSGAGNLAPPPTVKPPPPPPLTNAQKLAKALKACRQKPKKKRPACERKARATYAPHKAKKGSKAKKPSTKQSQKGGK